MLDAESDLRSGRSHRLLVVLMRKKKGVKQSQMGMMLIMMMPVSLLHRLWNNWVGIGDLCRSILAGLVVSAPTTCKKIDEGAKTGERASVVSRSIIYDFLFRALSIR